METKYRRSGVLNWKKYKNIFSRAGAPEKFKILIRPRAISACEQNSDPSRDPVPFGVYSKNICY
jgi:hypothetical protein